MLKVKRILKKMSMKQRKITSFFQKRKKTPSPLKNTSLERENSPLNKRKKRIEKAKKQREAFKTKSRSTYSLVTKRTVVKEILVLKDKDARPESVVREYCKVNGYKERLVRKWLNKTEFQPGYELVGSEKEKKYRVGKNIGRPEKVPEHIQKLFRKYVEKKQESEDQLSYSKAKKWFSSYSYELNDSSLNKFLKKHDFAYKKKSNKPKKHIIEEEIKKWELFLGGVRRLKKVILLNVDEKPLRILKLSEKSIVTKDNKHVSFEDGGRSAKSTRSLVVGTWIIMEKGEITDYGVCDLGVLMKSTSINHSIPQCWDKVKKSSKLTNSEKQAARKMFVRQSLSGYMSSYYWPFFLKHFTDNVKEKILKKHPSLKLLYNFIPKYFITDSAPGYQDAGESTAIQQMWVKLGLKGWKLQYIPKNSSDRNQPNDKGVNVNIDNNLYRKLSDKWVEEKHKTSGGKFQLPGVKVLLTLYIKLWAIFNEKVVKISWIAANIPKTE